MKAIILYTVALLVAGGAAFYTYQNANNFKQQQKVRLETIETNRQKTAVAVDTEAKLKDERTALSNAQDQREEATQSIASLKSAEITLKHDQADLTAELDKQNAELKALEKTLEAIKVVLKELGGDVDLVNFPDKINEIKETKKGLERDLDEVQTKVAGAEKRLANNKAESNRLTDKELERNNRHARNAMESVITAVNQDWGFVVIGAGSNTGFTPQTMLLVKRDGRLIGRVQPSAIERTQTIAEVIMDSMAPGVRLQPGDRVILAKPESN